MEQEASKTATTLVAGATGATGQLLVALLLELGQRVRVVVRSANRLPESIKGHANLSATEASLLDLSDGELRELARGCDAVASCLGHNLTFKGVFGKPRWLVRDAAIRLCGAIKANRAAEGFDAVAPTRYVLMNSAGCSNRDLNEPVSFAQRRVIGLLRALLPPHADNEAAADFLRTKIGQGDSAIEWAAVRPDSLIDAAEASPIEAHPSPIRSAIFDPGKTSRINVAHFMARLVVDDAAWGEWKGRMPVIYNKSEATPQA
jgi:NADPH:quinone reductase-like Zn-dependent oxidoreductase